MRNLVAVWYLGGLLILSACTDEPPFPNKTAGPITAEPWSTQDRATNVQDWDRVAQKIAAAMQQRGLLAAPPAGAAGPPFYLHPMEESPFLGEVSVALAAEILQHHGRVATSPDGAITIDLAADIVSWGSRRDDDPYRQRTEVVWTASILSGNELSMVVREPIYIFASDVSLYGTFSRPVRQLHYSTQAAQ